MTQGRREDKCPSARAGKRPRAGGAERGRAHAPPLSLRGRSAVGFCLFRTVICLLLMMWLFLLLLLRIPLYSITDWHRSPISDSHPFDQPGT
ncbi:hypothetical protein [Escherichia coli]|uniref:hypothetical protein n=1 Tax=Escherichia coli TaxID=562 RepID=UPI003467788F